MGRYPCCGERAYRFQLLPDYTGCQFREHTVCSKDVKDNAIFGLLENYRQIIEEESPQLMFPERLTRLVARDSTACDNRKLICKENFWWEGIQIIPPRPKLGILTGVEDKGDKQESPPISKAETSEDEEPSISSSIDSSSVDSVESILPQPSPQPQKVR